MATRPRITYEIVQRREEVALEVRGCVDTKCTTVDMTTFPKDQRLKASEVRDMLLKQQRNEYEQKTCVKVGGIFKGGLCEVPTSVRGRVVRPGTSRVQTQLSQSGTRMKQTQRRR